LRLLKEGLDLGTKGEIATTRDEINVRRYNTAKIINNI